MSFNTDNVSGLRIKDEGITVVNPATSLDFVGAGVTASSGGNGLATISIAGGAGSSSARNEHPTDNADGTYTLAHAPIAGTVQVYKNGILLNPGAGNDYTISGSVITLLITYDSSAIITADYLF
jgi:hypothetical protein